MLDEVLIQHILTLYPFMDRMMAETVLWHFENKTLDQHIKISEPVSKDSDERAVIETPVPEQQTTWE